MADCWEDQEEEAAAPPPAKSSFSFNPGASSFSFNPGAASFTADSAEANDASAAHTPEDGAAQRQGGAKPSKQEVDAATSGVAAVSVTATAASAGGDAVPADATPAADTARAAGAAEDTTKASYGGGGGGSGADSIATEKTEGEAVAAPAVAAALGSEQKEEETDEVRQQVYEALAREDSRTHMNVVFIGHVDAGKSTLGGQILVLMGGVDERTIEKYQKEAKENNRETWYMAYVMDTNDEERAKGKTVEVGRAHFQTEKKRYTILDAPGHKNFVPNMISGASQADIGVLVISARKGEFETGYERGGQTREHALLAKTLGVQRLIVVVNKMDDPSIADGAKWSKVRYDEIVGKLTPFLRRLGYNPARDFAFCPLAALSGGNVRVRPAREVCDWWDGPTLFELLDGTDAPSRDPMASFRMPIMDRYKDMGTVVMGKSESGVVQVGHSLVMMPNNQRVKVLAVWRDDDEVRAAGPGENLRVRLAGVDEDHVSNGFVLSGPRERCPVVTKFQCQLQLLDLLDHKSIFTAGYKSILHVHALTEECEVLSLDAELNLQTKEMRRCKFAKSGAVVICRIALDAPICVETFEANPQLGRFTLRDEGRTIAIGKITRLPPGAAAAAATQ